MKGTGHTDEIPANNLSNRSLRLTFAYEGSDIQLVSTKSRTMIAPPSDRLKTEGSEYGFWYEVRNKEDRPLYRRIIHNPIQYAVEIRTGDSKEPLKWETVKNPKGTFAVLIPDLVDGKTFVLINKTFNKVHEKGETEEIARFDITKKE